MRSLKSITSYEIGMIGSLTFSLFINEITFPLISYFATLSLLKNPNSSNAEVNLGAFTPNGFFFFGWSASFVVATSGELLFLSAPNDDTDDEKLRRELL